MNLNFNVSEPVEKNNITAFFLSSIEKNNNKYLSFSEAIAKNQVQISEVNKKGLVTKLSVSNKSSDNIIILNGELIIGTQIRQDRIVDSTVLIPGYATVLINTFCGEQYRWSPRLSNKISTSESLYFSSGRANNAADINTKLSKQCRIWSEISEKISDFNVKSFTNSVGQIYKKKKVNVEEIVNFFKIPSEAVGVALGINNQLVNIDIFSKFNDILNPNGFLFFEVPNCPKEYFQGRPYDSPHLLFFTSKSMHKIAKMHNMEFANFSYSSYSFDDDHKYQRESQNLYEELNKSKFSSAKIKQMLNLKNYNECEILVKDILSYNNKRYHFIRLANLIEQDRNPQLKNLRKIFEINNIEYIKAETLTAQLNFEENLDNGTEIAFDEVNTRLIIQKH